MATQLAPQPQPGANIVRVPSRSNPNVRHYVDLDRGYCSCPRIEFTPRRLWLTTKCAHKQLVAAAHRQSTISRMPVATIIERATRGCGVASCVVCVSGYKAKPCPRSEEGRAVWQAMVVNDEIGRAGL
jgi:hypothetical protein